MLPDTDVVTGSFGYIGKYITRRLLGEGRRVKTITTHPNKENPFGEVVTAYPYNFDKPHLLVENLRGAHTLYNTYWVRFEYGGITFRQAVENSRTLFRCAAQAGIKKVVHIGVTHASENSPLPYFKGKAKVEKVLVNCGLPYTIVRPTVVFGKEDILINNIAWMMRKFPVFPIFGAGQYLIQPVYVEDLASIAVASADDTDSRIIDAVGPETFTFEELLRLIASKIEQNVKFVHLPPTLGLLLGHLIGLVVGDVVLTKDELKGLMDNLLYSEQSPNGETLFSEWLSSNKHSVGRTYSSELKRHFRR
ncbi:NmrA family NAD(P)-binding protein [Acidobacteria bacterium AH-259-G07]|nr:NmrA family NAD(P)-binding protein [Acidobacteria bacterium AH-259-G07]